MAKLLLINPSYSRTYGSGEGSLANPIYPVLSLATLAATARRAGHDVRICDMSFMRYDPGFVRNLLREERPDVVGITATTPLANQMLDMSFIAKEVSPAITTVGGGPHATALPEETLRQSLLDFVAFGEGDLTIVDILDGKRDSDIAGICRREEGRIVRNDARSWVQNLDDLPFPAFDLYPVDEYRKHVTRLIARATPVSTIEFSRGCVFKCDFCASKNTMGYGYRKKSPERCAEEMLYMQRLGFREVVLADDIFTSDNNWAIAVCEEFIKRDVRVAWTCTNGIRVDSANDELFRVMKRAGCYRVHFGFESGNDEVLDAFGKGGKASLEQGIHAVDMARRVGLETFGMFMLGLSADTEKTMRDTIDYAKRVKVDAMRFGITVPFPGTRMFDQLHRQGRIKSYDWDYYNVFNDAQALYDHPHLSWETINRFYHMSHVDAYLKNPGYILRRLKKNLANLEFAWDAYYFLRFLWILMKPKGAAPSGECYAYEDVWRARGVDAANFIYSEPIKVRSDRAATAGA
ncbi:MAG: B12-binding domain-containing radical SAM protein [Candidatus Nitricoxidivorans perseverans]|uniref:B12-binding domain-containing radical SAM protein n=1 Tax=Candidatus Nitricoxidivorans perseverans TaxID=2975601 RepID=A0AA49FK68_9PROT|nr:MAG: B12-binding domain-containing radical SAM protein [Candidatus Nitricoxidivorans perseverans]